MAKLFQVYHDEFQTDRMGSTTSIVEALCKEDAMLEFNKARELKKKDPMWCYYQWNEVTDIKNVSELKVLNR